MLKADLGEFLYIIIFVVVMLFGVLEKIVKAKQQKGKPVPPHPEDDFEDVEHHPSEAPPQTIEEMIRRMKQTIEAPQPEEVVSYPKEAQSLEYIPLSGRHYYHPEEIRIREQSEIESFSPSLIEEETNVLREYEFDIRQAIIASEILNRKY